MGQVLAPSSSGPDALPPGWARRSLAETCQPPEYGYTATAERAPVGPRFLRITDIQDNGVRWDSVPFCRCEGPARARLALRTGDLLVARIGGTTGKTFLVRECPEALFASYLIRLRPRFVDPEFLYYFTKSSFYWRQVDAHKGEKLKGGISGSVLKSLVHPCPPLPEQRAIAAALRALELRLQVESDRLGALRALKAATMAKLFCDGVNGAEQQETEVGTFPSHWHMTTLGDPTLAAMTAGGTPSRSRPEFYGGGIPWVKSGELGDSVVRSTEETLTTAGLNASSAKMLPAGTLLVAMYGATAGATGILGIPASTNQAVCAIQPVEGSFIPEFLRHYLILARDRLLSARHGGAQPNLSQQILRGVQVATPPVEEQKEIAARLVAVGDVIRATESRATALRVLFDETLRALMTGGLRLGTRGTDAPV